MGTPGSLSKARHSTLPPVLRLLLLPSASSCLSTSWLHACAAQLCRPYLPRGSRRAKPRALHVRSPAAGRRGDAARTFAREPSSHKGAGGALGLGQGAPAEPGKACEAAAGPRGEARGGALPALQRARVADSRPDCCKLK